MPGVLSIETRGVCYAFLNRLSATILGSGHQRLFRPAGNRSKLVRTPLSFSPHHLVSLAFSRIALSIWTLIVPLAVTIPAASSQALAPAAAPPASPTAVHS